MSHRFNDFTLCWLYKFFSLDEKELSHIERIFTHGELYFSPISKFNDPFDCRPRYEWNGSEAELRVFMQGVFQRKVPFLSGEALHGEIKSTIELLSKPENIEKSIPLADAYLRHELNKLGICCFSEDWSNVLMWSHYAAKHSGICLRFRAKSDTPFFCRAQRVIYKREYPVINLPQQPLKMNLESAVLHKAKFWDYEKEWRIIEYDAGTGIQIFPLNLLHSVILGMQISEPHEKLVRDWASKMKHKPPVLKVTPTENSYGFRLT